MPDAAHRRLTHAGGEAKERVDQWVAARGVSSRVFTITRSTWTSPIDRGAPGRGREDHPGVGLQTGSVICPPVGLSPNWAATDPAPQRQCFGRGWVDAPSRLTLIGAEQHLGSPRIRRTGSNHRRHLEALPWDGFYESLGECIRAPCSHPSPDDPLASAAKIVSKEEVNVVSRARIENLTGRDRQARSM
jgi:hypothetical protein